MSTIQLTYARALTFDNDPCVHVQEVGSVSHNVLSEVLVKKTDLSLDPNAQFAASFEDGAIRVIVMDSQVCK